MDSQNTKLALERGPVRVSWEYENEGYNGEFDPHDPEDTMLLRFHCIVKDAAVAQTIASETRRTCFAADAPLKAKAAALEILLDRFYDYHIHHPEKGLSALADTLSYISAETYYTYASADNVGSNPIAA